MEGLESVDVVWAQGYDGSRAEFITKDTLCFKCGNSVKFLKEDGTESIYPTDGNSCLAVHGINKVFAFADHQLPPVVHIVAYPSLETQQVLKDGAKMEYTCMRFSHSEYIVTVTGVPEYQLIVWHYVDGTRLCSTDLSHVVPICLEFNPANWRQLACATQKELTLWTIESCDDTFVIKQSKTKLPPTSVPDDKDDELNEENEESAARPSTRLTQVSIPLPQSSITGMKAEDAEKFDEYQDHTSKVEPKCHLWTPTGDVLIGCADGQILRVDGESLQISSIFAPNPRAQSAYSRDGSAKPGERETSHTPELSGQSSSELTMSMGEGSVNCMVLHKKGLFAAGEDGVLRHIEITSDRTRVQKAYPVGLPITSLAFNASHNKLGLGSSKGSLFTYEPDENTGVMPLSDVHHGAFVGAEMLCPGNEHCVSVREDGEIQVWNMKTAKLTCSLSVGPQAVSLACSPSCSVVAVGTASGYLYFVDLTHLEKPKIVQCTRLYKTPLKHLQFTLMGNFLLTGSDESKVCVIDGRASKSFEPLGYVDVLGAVEAISTLDEGSCNVKGVVIANTSGNQGFGANKIIYFNLSNSILNGPTSFHGSLKCDFDNQKIKRIVYNIAIPSHGLCAIPDGCALTLAHATKQLHKLPLPEKPPKKENSKDSFLQATDQQTGHELPGGRLLLSPHLQWLASCGPDGRITMRSVGALDKPAAITAHDYKEGGIQSLAFTADCSALITCGGDGVLACHRIRNEQKEAEAAKESCRQRYSNLTTTMNTENRALANLAEWSPPAESRPNSGKEKADREKLEKEMNDESNTEHSAYITPLPSSEIHATWAELMEIEAIKEEDKEYAEVKNGLRSEIGNLRKKLKVMMSDNENVPENEKLNHHEFDLDMEEQRRVQADGEAEVARIREDMALENLAKTYMADLIKKECWDNMVVKGRGISAFSGNMEVSNYPMKARSEEELSKLREVQEQRELEMEERVARKNVSNWSVKNARPSQDDEGNETAEVEEMEEIGPSIVGSLGSEYGGGSKLFYSQFELHNREQQINQTVLLQDAIHRIKENFNKDFVNVYERKEVEIEKIKDKNKRIRKIVEDLNMDSEIFEPSMGVVEKPEQLLFVTDAEVKAEKHLTPEQRKKQEEEQKLEDERKLRERDDNWRDRGLDVMMGGVLEVKKEDVLKKDVPKPAFLTSKPEEEWTDEDKKQIAEYEKRVKDLEEEREKYRKQLEVELKKLQGQIQDSAAAFDEALQQLFHKKIKTEMVIYQEELKMLRLRYCLLREEEMNNTEKELNETLQFKTEMKHLSSLAVAQARKQVDAFREQYDILVAEDKVMDKAFRREFHDIPNNQVEQLYKLFRRRPRGQKARGGETPIYDPTSGNPFSERPSTAMQNEMQRAATEAALAELDKTTNAPDNVEPHVWERMCQYRRQKIEREHLVKQKALVLAEMQSFLNKRQEEDESLRQEIEELLSTLNRLKENKRRFLHNLEVQLLLKQGQVEVDAGPFIHDYSDSLLLHRSGVEDLNATIRQLGDTKINSMTESKDFRKSIVQLEWEHRKMTMEMEDLQNKMRDIQMMKVTREIQGFLNEEDHDAKKAQEIQILENTLTVQTQNYEKSVEERKRTLKDLNKIIKDKMEENEALKNELEELNVSVNERRHIHEVNAEKRSDAGAEQRYREIVQRRKLVELAKAQAQEVAVLRAEVERLRMRTFPALVQVGH